MNHTYRTIWSKSKNTFVAVSENTALCGKASSGQKSIARAVAVALFTLSGTPAFASGGIINGSSSVTGGTSGIIDGGSAGGYFVQSGSLTVSNATLSNFSTVGGTGSGGGAGLGGAIFVNTGSVVTLNNVNLIGNTVTGGDGGVGLVGGMLNNVFPINLSAYKSAGDGANGVTPTSGFDHVGNGANGLNGKNGSWSIDNGGAGGNGGDGLSENMALKTAAAIETVKLAAATKEASIDAPANAALAAAAVAAAGVSIPPSPAAVAAAANLVKLAEERTTSAAINVALATASSAAALKAVDDWNTALSNGELGIGGRGGNGGMGGGNGEFAVLGATGGNGGNGGNGGSDSSGGADGGDGGDGGQGGMGGFGSGGGSGGNGGLGGNRGYWARSDGHAGAGGAGGKGGFGAGDGSTGSGYNTFAGGGNGGSGYGGAIFVRDGGSLVVTGNSTFERNESFGGSGQVASTTTLAGEAGSAAGSDLFIMKGSSVVLAPGKGNTITFNGTIADDSAASITSALAAGSGAGLTVKEGLVIFNGENTYTGVTKIETGGVLQAQDGSGTSANGDINFSGINSNSNIEFAGGVLQANGTFDRFVGTKSDRVQWAGSGGFSAVDGDLKITLSNNAKQKWATSSFVGNGSSLLFGSDSATHKTTFTNAIDLNGGNRSIMVEANANNTDTATLTGVLSNGALTVGDATHKGTLILTNANTYAGGTTINGGALVLSDKGALNADGAMTVGSDAELDMSGTGDQSIGTLAGDGEIKLGKNTLTVNQAGSSTFSGALQDGGLSGGTGANVTLQGGGDLTLAGQNTYTGATQVKANTTLTLTGALASGAVTVENGSTLTDTNSGLAANATLTNDGTLNFGADDTVATLTNTGTVNGTGKTLTADTYALNNASVINANLGTGVVTANGIVLLNGTSSAAKVVIASGTTTLGDAERLLDTADVTVTGDLILGGDEKIGKLTNTGKIDSAGKTLTADTYALNDGSVINANLGTGALTANGNVALNGTSSASTVAIASGTTTLGAAERLLDTAAVTVEGNLLLGGNEKIGQLLGAGNVDLSLGRLTVDSGNFSGVLHSNNSTYGLRKVSSGNLTLAGANTYTTATLIDAGTLTLIGSLDSGAVAVAKGATLTDTNSGLAADTALTNDGTLNLGADDSVATLTNTGTVNGDDKTLTATTYALNDGSVINANLGAGTLTTNGIVTLNGTSSAEKINILSGSILNLGEATAPAVLNPASAAKADLSNSRSRLINSAAVTLDGILNLNGGDEYIKSLSGTGEVNLNVNELFISDGGTFSGKIKGSTANLNAKGKDLTLKDSETTVKSTDVGDGSSVTLAGKSTLNSSTITLGNKSTLNLDSTSDLNYDTLKGGDVNKSGGTINAANFTNKAGSNVAGFLTFTGNFVNNGVLSPGNSPGLTTIAGNYTENGIYRAQLETTTPITGHDQIRVGGAVTLNPTSTLIAEPWAGALPSYGDTYQIIANSAGGSIRANGAFGNVLFDNASPAAPVSNAAVVFDVNTGKLLATGLNAANSKYADIGTNANQHRAANALMSVAMSDVGSNQIDSLTNVGKSASALLTSGKNAVERLTPEYYGSMTDFSLMTNKTVSNVLFSDSSSLNGATGRDSSGDEFGMKNVYAGYTDNQYSVSNHNTDRNDSYFGAEVGNDKTSLGLLLMDSKGSLHSTHGGGSVQGQGVTAYLKTALTPKLNLSGSIGNNTYDYKLDRSSVTGTASASTTGRGKNASLGVTYLASDKDDYSIQPHAEISYGKASVKGFQETGSEQRLDIADHKASRLSGKAGVKFTKSLKAKGRDLKVAMDVGVEGAFRDRKEDINATMLTDTRVNFPITPADNLGKSGYIGLSADYKLTKSASISAKYMADTASHNNNAAVELKFSF